MVKHLESKVCENGCDMMPKNGRFWPFSMGDAFPRASREEESTLFYKTVSGINQQTNLFGLAR